MKLRDCLKLLKETEMDTKQLEYIVTIAEESNITKAAERVYISQPALSQQLKSLEQELGTPLFTREGRSLKPTKAGLVYLNGARAILNIKKNLENTVPARKTDRLTICVSGAVPSSLTRRAADALQQAHSDTIVEIKKMPCSRALRQLLNGYCDFVIVEMLEGQPEWPLQYFPVTTQRLCLVHKMGTDFTPESADRLILSPQGTALRKIEDSLIKELGIKPWIIKESFDKSLTAEMVQNGYCCAFLMESMVEDYPRCCMYEKGNYPEIKFAAVYNAGIMNLQELSDFF